MPWGWWKLLLLLAAILPTISAFAVSPGNLSADTEQLQSQTNRARGMALSILKQIKQLDSDCRGPGNTPIPGKTMEARTRLGRLERLVTMFRQNVEEAERLAGGIETRLSGLTDGDALRGQLSPTVKKAGEDLRKYARLVDKYYSRSISAYGQPIADAPTVSGLTGDERLSLTGEFAAALGTSKYKQPHANPVFEADAADFAIGVKGQFLPAKRTNIQFHLNNETKVERRKIGLTGVGASVMQILNDNMTLAGGLDLMKYSDKDNDVFNFSDRGLFARFNLGQANRKFDAELRSVKRGYSNVDGADYTTKTFLGNAVLPAGVGRFKLRLRYLSRTYEIDFFDHTELNPSAIWQFSESGSEVGLSYQQFARPNLDDSPFDNNRIKAHLQLKSQRGSKTTRWGPEVMMYSYPNDEDRDFIDFKLIRKTTGRDKKYSSTDWQAVYRKHKDSTQFDFAQITYRRSSRPIGSGVYSRLNLAGRVYTESSDEDDPLRFANVAPPHTVDFYWAFGWIKSGKGWFQRLSIGPIIGTKFYMDTERADAFDEDVVDVDYVARNPQNTGRIGLEFALAGSSLSGITWRVDLKDEFSIYYNADPQRSNNMLELNGQVTYPVNDQWVVDGYTRFYSNNASTESASDLNKYNIGVQVRYLFDIRR